MASTWGLRIVTRVIVKQSSMETTQNHHTFKRRSFFKRLAGALAGGWIAGNLFPGIMRSTTNPGKNEPMQITINPLAVPRTKQDGTSHGA